MKFWDLLKIANRNLIRNKLRTLLTVAAIFVGSFTLTMTNGIGDGVRSYVDNQIKNIEGDAVLFVRRKIDLAEGVPRRDAPSEYKEESAQPVDRFSGPLITQTQMDEALGEIHDVKSVLPQYELRAEYITLDGQKKYRLNLDTAARGVSQKTEVGESISGNGQVVLSLALGKELDANLENLIGQNVNIAYRAADKSMMFRSLRVVGVATKGLQSNRSSFVDPTTAAAIYNDQHDSSERKFFSFTVQLSSADQAKIEAVKKTLLEKGFMAETFADQQKQIYDAIGIFKLAMGLVAFIALFAASFGIINTLVIAVLERTREIGLQKALGMGRGKIFAIFSLESVLIGFWGAMLGTVAGIIIGLIANQVLINVYAESFEGYRLFVFTIPSILLVTLLVCTIAFLAGVLPAIRASRLNPIESLRYE